MKEVWWGGGAIWFHAPFLQFKENPPRDDPHSEGGGDWSSSAQAQLARQHTLRSWEGHRKLGTGLRWYSKARKNVFFFSSVSHRRGNRERKDSMFLTWFIVLEASFHMTWDMTSTCSSEAFGAPEGRPWTGQNSDISMNWRQKQQQRPS